VKSDRELIQIRDFSKGLVTNQGITNMETNTSPDCLNVYTEGQPLRKRAGNSKLNTNTIAAGSQGNGMFNWVKTGATQELLGVFGAELYKMDLSGSAWDGTFDIVNEDSSLGTQLGDSITHFASFGSTLLMTQEARIKPQKLLATSTSYSDIDRGTGAMGTAPVGKYINVWKEHVWILNIGDGDIYEETEPSLSGWTTSGGASPTTTSALGSIGTFQLDASGANDAILTRDVVTGDMDSKDIIFEFKAHFDTIHAATNDEHAECQFDNGIIDFRARFSTQDGLELYDGASWNSAGVNVVAEDTFNTWKFVITGGTATGARCEVLKDGEYVALNGDVTNASASTVSSGEIQFIAYGSNATVANWNVTNIKVSASSAQSEFYTDGKMETWTGTTSNDNTDRAIPDQPLVHYKMNDTAADTTITNNGINSNIAIASVNVSLITTTGLIGTALNFTSASSHNVVPNTATRDSIKDDTEGSVAMWVFPNGSQSAEPKLFIITEGSVASENNLNLYLGGGDMRMSMNIASTNRLVASGGTIATGTWNHLAWVQDGTEVKFYVNGSSVTINFSIDVSDGKSLWFGDIGTLDTIRIGCNHETNTNNQFYNGRIDDLRYYSKILTSSIREIIVGEPPSILGDTQNELIAVPSSEFVSNVKKANPLVLPCA